MKAYTILKEVVFWTSVLGFLLFAGWVYSMQDKLSIAYVGYPDGTRVQGNCQWIKELYENVSKTSFEDSCQKLAEEKEQVKDFLKNDRGGMEVKLGEVN